MEKKYYKLDVSNLFNLGYYSLKKDQDSAANIHNVYSLNYYYEDRYRSLMKHVNSLAYDNYWYRENNTVSSKERASLSIFCFSLALYSLIRVLRSKNFTPCFLSSRFFCLILSFNCKVGARVIFFRTVYCGKRLKD